MQPIVRQRVCERLDDVRLTDEGLTATARGEPYDPQRHRLDHEVKAITYHKNDARYHYFLGLSQHAQKDKEKEVAAQHNIKFGAFLEVQDLPAPRDINLSLERIQGPLRLYLNGLKAEAKLTE